MPCARRRHLGTLPLLVVTSPSILALDGTLPHDSSVTVIHQGQIFAVECERIDRLKKSCGYAIERRDTERGPILQLRDPGNPHAAIRYCLDLAGIDRVDRIVYGREARLVRHLGLERYLLPGGRMEGFPSHHLAHACSAFYYSDFERAAVLVVDASGPDRGNPIPALQSMYHFDGGRIREVRRTFATDTHPLGIGIQYFLHTKLMDMEEGSIMGLSSYGDASRYPQRLLARFGDHLRVDPAEIDPVVRTDTRAATETSLFAHYGLDPHRDRAVVEQARRQPEQSFLADIAAKLQRETEDALVSLANDLHDVTGATKLCLAGGVALNSVANHKILQRTPFDEIFIQPAANDAGISLGMALFSHHHTDGQPRRRRPNVFLGRGYDDDEIQEVLDRYAACVEYERPEDIYDRSAALLEREEVIAFFQGRLEFGPRALGHRSILAHPGSTAVRDRVNDIKRRERWRPLAPAVLDGDLSRFFVMEQSNPYMLLVADVTDEARERAPAIVHADGTARPQSVSADENPTLHRLLSRFRDRTGLPLVINTSLNDRGEPMIEHPEQAVLFLLNSDLDALAIGSFLVRARSESARRTVPTRVVVAPTTPPPLDCDALRARFADGRSGLRVIRAEFRHATVYALVELRIGDQARTADAAFVVEDQSVARIDDARRGRPMGAAVVKALSPIARAIEALL